MKTCTKCGEGKPLSDFAIAKSKRDGRASACKACHREHYGIKYYDLDRDRSYNLNRKYGLTIEEFDSMLVEQDYKCKICSKDLADQPRRPHVDHCHATEKVRGLLCGPCNRGIGYLGDDPDRLLEAWYYLMSARIKAEK